MINYWNELPVKLMNLLFFHTSKSTVDALLDLCDRQTYAVVKYKCFTGVITVTINGLSCGGGQASSLSWPTTL